MYDDKRDEFEDAPPRREFKDGPHNPFNGWSDAVYFELSETEMGADPHGSVERATRREPIPPGHMVLWCPDHGPLRNVPADDPRYEGRYKKAVERCWECGKAAKAATGGVEE